MTCLRVMIKCLWWRWLCKHSWRWLVYIVGWSCVFGRLKCVVIGEQNVFVNFGNWGIKVGWKRLKSRKQTVSLGVQMADPLKAWPAPLILRGPPLIFKGAALAQVHMMPEFSFWQCFSRKVFVWLFGFGQVQFFRQLCKYYLNKFCMKSIYAYK